MSIRRQRTHWTGKSNRQRAKKYPEVSEAEVERMQGNLTISDTDFAAINNGWSKAVKIFEEPSIIRTRLGGKLYRPLSRCDSKQYLEVLEENLEKRMAATFVQPEWTNDQPRMGIPIWSNEPMQAKVFSTDGINAHVPDVVPSHH